MKRARILIPLALIAALAPPLRAQQCQVTNTPLECIGPLLAVTVGKADKTGESVNTTNTGNPDLAAIENTSLRDFLSVFTAAFRSAKVGEENGAVILDYNLPITLMNEKDVIKFQGTFVKPELDSALKTKLDTNAAAISSLADSLDEMDDVTLSATYSPSNEDFGRSFAPHREFVEGLMDAIPPDADALVAQAAGLAQGTEFADDKPFSVIDDMDKRAKILDLYQRAAAALPKLIGETDDAVKMAANLINNQKQAYLKLQYHDRNELAGASGWSIKGTYEFGGKNISRFRKANASCGPALASANRDTKVACLTSFRQYAGDMTDDPPWRLAASLDFQRTNANTIDISELTMPVKSAQSDTRIVSITAGRRMDAPTSNRERRIDITGAYEDVTDDADRDDRLVATITWTQELSDSMSFPITLTYANKERYLGDPDARLGVHFGISYKLPKSQ